MFGKNTVVVDSDALIGLINKDDALHKRCIKVSEFLAKNSFSTIVPYPIVLEAATALAKDKTIKRPDLAKRLLEDYCKLDRPKLNESSVPKLTAKLFDPEGSKRNTPFDHYVAAVAEANKIKFVFSFDSFYKKRGLKLIEDII